VRHKTKNKMATYKNFEFIKETEKAINVKLLVMGSQIFVWIPKSCGQITDNGVEVVDWFDKKEVEVKLPSVRSFTQRRFN
jgi:hypothetical protein